MILEIKFQENYSRGQLLLRSFFGWLYIVIPHIFLLMFLQIWSSILTFIAFWSILFTGRYPKSFFDFQVKLLRWNMRVNARIYNLSDGYPKFGLNAVDPNIILEVPYPEKLSRIMVLVKLLFGIFYVLIPHMIVLMFVSLAANFLLIANWFIILFTGKSDLSFHTFLVGTLRWSTKINLYMGFMTDTYPPFRISPLPEEVIPGLTTSEYNQNEYTS